MHAGKLGESQHRLPKSDDPRSWCHRRVVTFRFVAQRRAHWTVEVEFTPTPAFLETSALTTRNEVLVPLLTCSKDILPRAHVGTSDEQGHGFPIAATRTSRTLACMILMWFAEQAGVWSKVIHLLGHLTDTDPRVSARAFDELEDCLTQEQRELVWHPTHSVDTDMDSARRSSNVVDFATAARLFNRSVLVMAGFPIADAHQNVSKIATFTYDAPIRLTRIRGEHLGLSPLRVAPLTLFGGDADSYHVQLEPPPGVVVVDTRLLYSYTATLPLAASYGLPDYAFPDKLLPASERHRREAVAARKADPSPGDEIAYARARPLPRASSRQGWRRWWGFVLGSSEPMPAHVHVGGQRLPRLIDGRDVVTIFHVYPDMSAFAGLLVAAAANWGYVLGLFAALVLPGGFHTGLYRSPEPIFLLGVLVAGFGSGLALYKKEHILTDQVARPWRLLFGVEVVAVLGSFVALLMGTERHSLPTDARVVLSAMLLAASLAAAYLAWISRRAWIAQRAGIKPSRKQGYSLRRMRFSKGRVPDIVEADTLRAAGERFGPKGQKKTDDIMERHASNYLDEATRRALFNEGVPPSSRHDPESRGSSGTSD
jgi:hypothetical protein